jgi:hypothetical protein
LAAAIAFSGINAAVNAIADAHTAPSANARPTARFVFRPSVRAASEPSTLGVVVNLASSSSSSSFVFTRVSSSFRSPRATVVIARVAVAVAVLVPPRVVASPVAVAVRVVVRPRKPTTPRARRVASRLPPLARVVARVPAFGRTARAAAIAAPVIVIVVVVIVPSVGSADRERE